MLHFRLASERMPLFMQYGGLLCAYSLTNFTINYRTQKRPCRESFLYKVVGTVTLPQYSLPSFLQNSAPWYLQTL